MLQVARRNKWAVASIIAAAAMGGVAASQSEAKLVIDVKAVSIATGPGAISADGKTVTGASAGTKINYRVTGQIFVGANNSGDVDIDSDFDTVPDQNDDLIQSVEGIIASSGTGTVQVNLTHAVNTASGNAFNATGSSNGTPTNLGGDTDIDIGPSLTPQNGTTGNINYRSNGAIGTLATNLFNLNLAATTTAAGPSTMTVLDTAGNDALINWTTSAVFGVGGQPQWTENGIVKNQVNGDTIELGAPVRILGSGGVVPEPASLGLLGLGAVGLLRRRRA
jgi:hypothetical protein